MKVEFQVEARREEAGREGEVGRGERGDEEVDWDGLSWVGEMRKERFAKGQGQLSILRCLGEHIGKSCFYLDRGGKETSGGGSKGEEDFRKASASAARPPLSLPFNHHHRTHPSLLVSVSNGPRSKLQLILYTRVVYFFLSL